MKEAGKLVDAEIIRAMREGGLTDVQFKDNSLPRHMVDAFKTFAKHSLTVTNPETGQ